MSWFIDLIKKIETISDKLNGTISTSGTLSVSDYGLTYSSVPVSSISYIYTGDLLSTINFLQSGGGTIFSLKYSYSGDTVTTVERI